MSIEPVASAAGCAPKVTTGATMSTALQRRRCVWSSSVLSKATVLSCSPPPHPAMARHASACATNIVVWFFLSFMPNVQSLVSTDAARAKRVQARDSLPLAGSLNSSVRFNRFNVEVWKSTVSTASGQLPLRCVVRLLLLALPNHACQSSYDANCSSPHARNGMAGL